MHGVNRAPQPVPEVKIQYNCSIDSWDISHKSVTYMVDLKPATAVLAIVYAAYIYILQTEDFPPHFRTPLIFK